MISQDELQAANERATKAEQKYHAHVIELALNEAATKANAYAPFQLRPFLADRCRVIEVDGRQTVVVDSGDGQNEPLPAAIERLRGEHPNLFRDGAPSQAPAKPAEGAIDPAKLTHSQYRRLRETKPELIGLRPAHLRRIR